MAAGLKPPRRGEEMLAFYPSIKPEINRSSRKKRKMATSGNLLEGPEMLAFHPSIKPENQSLIKEK